MCFSHSVLANEKLKRQQAVIFRRVNGVWRKGDHSLSQISALMSILSRLRVGGVCIMTACSACL